MSKKVIYVSYIHLTDSVTSDRYINFLIAKGVTVEYWDLIPLLRGEFYEFGTKTEDYLRTFRTYGEVEAMLCRPENREAYYVMLLPYDGLTVRIFRLLSKYDCKILFIAWGAMPIRGVQKWRSLLSGFSDPLRLVEKLFYKSKAIANRKLKFVKPFDVVFAAGYELITKNLYATKVIPTNIPDYDQYRKVKMGGGRVVEGRYAVFLDVYLPYHSDLKFAGRRTVKPSDYYASLNRFFELLEVKYGIKVVIAAHPKADYRVEPFNAREIYHRQTSELVKDADFVIAHHSTSLSYAVLNYKPIVFIYTDEMVTLDKHRAVSYIRDFAGYLDAAIYNIDEITQGDQIVIREVNQECYDTYKYGFLTTHESENELAQDIFWREINAD